MKKTLIAILTLSAYIVSSYAQERTADVKRIEIEHDASVTVLSCNPIGDKGLILITKEKDKQQSAEKDYKILTFTKYDTLLNKGKSVDVTCLDKMYGGEITENGIIYWMNNVKKKNKYEVLLFDGEKMQSKVISGELEAKTYTIHEKLVGDYLYCYGSQGDTPIVLIINTKTGDKNLVTLSVTNKKKARLISFEPDEKGEEVHAFIKDKEESGYMIKFFTFRDGKLDKKYVFANEENGKFIESLYASKMDDGTYIISGTYSDKERGTSTIGIFLKKIDNGKTVFSTYTNYLDITNFTSYMSKHKQEKVEKKKEKKAQKDKEYTIKYNMLPYRVIEENNNYLLVGEAYYPTYVMKPYTEMVPTGNGGMTTKTTWTMEFDGYAFSHYFLINFNKEGVIEWSNAAPLSVMKTWFPYFRHLSISKDTKSLDITYPSFGLLNHISYGYNGEELKKEDIPYVGEEQKLKRYYSLQSQFWYRNNFVSSGLLKIKDDDGKRKIYSINKITFKK